MIFGKKEIVYNVNHYIWLRTFWRSLSIFNLFPIIFERIFFLSTLIIIPFITKGLKNKIIIIIWILFPLVLLSQYKGTISEYYYSMIISLIPFFLIFIFFEIIKKITLSTTISTILILLLLFNFIGEKKSKIVTLNDKKAIVNYLINQKQDQPFNISYEIENGFDFGFEYLFNYYGNPPQNVNNAHLYTLYKDNLVPQNSNIVFKQNIYSLVRR